MLGSNSTVNEVPSVSVIIPVYNVAKYLRQCLDSLVGQTLRDIEIICVDDGSTDGSGAILDEYAAKDARVRVIRQENAGAGAARNTGLDAARGEYLFFCDPDDWCKKGMLKAMYSRAKSTDADVVIAGRLFFDGTTGRPNGSRGLPPNIWLKRGAFAPSEIADQIFAFSPNVIWDKLFRREFVHSLGLRYQCIKSSNDLYFCHVALAAASWLAVAFGAWVCHRRQRPGSLQDTKDSSHDCIYRAYDATREKLSELGLFETFRLSHLEAVLSSGYYNLRTLNLPENRKANYAELRRKVLNLAEGMSEETLSRRSVVARRLRQVQMFSDAEELGKRVPPEKTKWWRIGFLPFRLVELAKIAVYLVRRAFK